MDLISDFSVDSEIDLFEHVPRAPHPALVLLHHVHEELTPPRELLDAAAPARARGTETTRRRLTQHPCKIRRSVTDQFRQRQR